MSKKKIIAFCPADANNMKYGKMMEASLRKFHSEEELPLRFYDNPTGDSTWWYRATPILATELLKEYETVVKIDADSIIFDRLDGAFEGDFSVAVANNSNPRDFKNYPYQFMNISPFSYVNNGFVVMKDSNFVDFWFDLCHSVFFSIFQMREQDALNFLVHSNHYKIKRLDEGDSFWNLASKGYEPEIVLKDGKPFLPKGIDEDHWPDKDKWIKLWHSAGGTNNPEKMNWRIKFNEEMINYIDNLVK